MRESLQYPILLVLLAATSVGAPAPARSYGAGPTLANQKLILKAGENSLKRRENKGFGSLRLSPDGKKLLYLRIEMVALPRLGSDPARPPRQRRVFRLVLRDLASGNDTVLPIPACAEDDFVVAMISSNIFDPAGKTIVLGVDTGDPEGAFVLGRTTMQVVLYDVASGKMKRLPITDEVIFPAFDRSGKGLIVLSMARRARTGKLITTPIDKVSPKQLARWGLPHPTCPAADVIPLLLPPVRTPEERRQERFVLYDYKADSERVELSTSPENTWLDDYLARWTADGRLCYYVDVKKEGERRRTLARIWDRTKGKEIGLFDGAVPMGHGPTPTTMILMKSDEDGKKTSLILHDAAADRTWTLKEGESLRPMFAEGKYVVYARKDAEGKHAAYLAQIKMPAAD